MGDKMINETTFAQKTYLMVHPTNTYLPDEPVCFPPVLVIMYPKS